MLCRHAPLPQLPAAARRMLDDSPAAAVSPDFELVHWNAATSVPSFSDSMQKRSFRDVLAAATTVTPLQQKEADLASFTLLSLPLPPLMRDASTSTTPTSSAHSSEVSDSDYEEERFAWEEEDELEDESLDFFSAESVDSADSASSQLLPLDLCSHCTEVDYDALEAEGASADSVLLSTPAAVDPFLLPRFRVRHRLLSHKPGSAKLLRYDAKQPTKDLHYYNRSNKSGSGIAHLQKAAVKTPKTPASAAVVPAPSLLGSSHQHRLDPYHDQDHASRMLARSMAPPKETVRTRSNGKKSGEAAAARKNTHALRQSLAAPTRPALINSSSSHRVILRDRAARKVQLVQAAASEPRPLPKHLRPNSKGTGMSRRKHHVANLAAAAPTPAPLPSRAEAVEDSKRNVRLTSCSDFEAFRYSFWKKFSSSIKTAIAGSVSGVRLAPIGSEARARFMGRMRSLGSGENDIANVYHGTRLQNMDSICRRGLLVPNRGNGVTVANGSALGVGIYTCQEASYPYGYASSTTSTIFVCAALTKGAKPPSADNYNAPSGAVVSGNVVVLMDEARVCPLFLLDIESSPRYYVRTPLPPPGEAPFVRVKTVRELLARAHAQLRKACASNSHVTFRELDSALFQ